ncbi:MAG TPA: imidazole glycerol phosphate synthase subunit HisH [Oculatellaceae cyanobacterium]
MGYQPGPAARPTSGKLSGNVQLIDVGGGAVASLNRFLQEMGIVCKQVTDGGDLQGGTPIIVSGVGTFAKVMQAVKDYYFHDKLIEIIKTGTPYLGIAVGMQILFEQSEESPGIPGLGLLNGQVVRFKKGTCQIGSNRIAPTPQFQLVYPKEEFVYFCNSYFAKPEQQEIISFNGNYQERFCAAIKFKNVTGFQFQPEQSKDAGVRLMTTWLKEALGQ